MGMGWGGDENDSHWVPVAFGGDKNVPKSDRGDGCGTL